MDIFYDAKNNDQANPCQAYGVTIGQCTETLRAKLEAKDRYEDISSYEDVIELLKLIKINPTATRVTSTSLELYTRPSASYTPYIKRSPPHAPNTLISSRRWRTSLNLFEDPLEIILSWKPK